ELGCRKHGRAQHLARDGTTRCLDVGNRDAHASPPRRPRRRRRGPLGPARGESALNHGALDRIPDTRPHLSFIPQMAVPLAQIPAMLLPLMESSIARINSEDIWS